MEILSHDSGLNILAIALLVSLLKTMVIMMIKKVSWTYYNCLGRQLIKGLVRLRGVAMLE